MFVEIEEMNMVLVFFLKRAPGNLCNVQPISLSILLPLHCTPVKLALTNQVPVQITVVAHEWHRRVINISCCLPS